MRSKELFGLEERYNKHLDIVQEIINKKSEYSRSYMDHVKSLLGLKDDGEVYRYVFGNYMEEKDFEKRPLSKLTKDIYNNT